MEAKNEQKPTTRTHYLGDGLYAHYDGLMIRLETERVSGKHWVSLEPWVFDDLLNFAKSIGWMDSEVKP